MSQPQVSVPNRSVRLDSAARCCMQGTSDRGRATMSEGAPATAKDERRREILDAAFAEFTAKGYAGASMEAIARRARASKETLYAWFENKETLFNTLLVSRLEGISNRVTAAAEADPSPAHVLPIIAEDVIRLMLAIMPLTQAMGPGEPGETASRLV